MYTEIHNIAYGIVAYSFVSRYSCLEFNCVFLKYMILFPYSYLVAIGYLQQYSGATVRVRVQYGTVLCVTLGKSETYKETKKETYSYSYSYEAGRVLPNFGTGRSALIIG